MAGDNNGFSFIYAVNSNFSQDKQNHAVGTLNWIKDVGRDTDQVKFEGPNVVGSGWQQPDGSVRAFAGKGGIIYSVMPDGTMRRFVHQGILDGTPKFLDGNGVGPIGSDFFPRFKHVFGGFENVIYAVEHDGTLRWFNDPEAMEHPESTSPGLVGGQAVGSGFDTPSKVFAGDFNAIYTIEGDTLFHRQHLGMQDGTNDWTEKKPISTRITAQTRENPVEFTTHTWADFNKVFTPGPMPVEITHLQGGYIYMVTPEGDLWRFRHFGFQSGTADTRGPDSLGKAPRALGENWVTVDKLFAGRI
jgi:hypothetical protein